MLYWTIYFQYHSKKFLRFRESYLTNALSFYSILKAYIEDQGKEKKKKNWNKIISKEEKNRGKSVVETETCQVG